MSKHADFAPDFVRFIGPVLAALEKLGGSGRPDEVRTEIARTLRISEEEQAKLLPSGVQSRFENQVHWARFYLVKGGYIDASRHGVWTLTDKARAAGKLSLVQATEIYRSVATQFAKSKGKSAEAVEKGAADEQVAPVDGSERR